MLVTVVLRLISILFICTSIKNLKTKVNNTNPLVSLGVFCLSHEQQLTKKHFLKVDLTSNSIVGIIIDSL